jgi:alanine racemase
VLNKRQVQAHEPIGYGSYTIPFPATVLTLAAGYGDGIPMSIIGYSFQDQGISWTFVGRVNMDMCFIATQDLVPKTPPFISLWSFDQSPVLQKLSEHCSTINYQLLTSISSRVPRAYEL